MQCLPFRTSHAQNLISMLPAALQNSAWSMAACTLYKEAWLITYVLYTPSHLTQKHLASTGAKDAVHVMEQQDTDLVGCGP